MTSLGLEGLRLRGEHLTIESLELSEYMRYSSERNQAINIQEVSGRQLPATEGTGTK